MAMDMSLKVTSPSIPVGHFRNQWYAVLAANIIVFSQGCLFGWLSPILPLLKSNDSPLTTGPLSTEEISWVVAIGSLGSLSTALIFRSVTNRLGCKRMMTSCIPILSFIAWSLFAFGRTRNDFLLARLIAGFNGAGIDSAALLYVSEIADDRIRGALGSTSSVIRVFGALSSFIVATYVDYSMVPFTFIGFPVLYFLLFVWLPNTAPYLIRVGKHEEAKKSIRFYKGYTGDSAETVKALNQEYERLLAVAAHHTKKSESITFQTLRKPIVYRGILIGIILTLLNQYAGGFTLISYSVMIFQQSNTHIDPYISSIVLLALQLAGTLSSTSLVERMGRKSLLIISMAGCALGMSTMASYTYLSSLDYDLAIVDWIPVVSLGFVVFISSVGISSLTYLCIVESLPKEARSFGLAVAIMSINLFAFVSSKLFPILVELICIDRVMFMYAIICGCGTIFVAIAIKETKGKCLDNVDEES